jgi:hypothetical protein
VTDIKTQREPGTITPDMSSSEWYTAVRDKANDVSQFLGYAETDITSVEKLVDDPLFAELALAHYRMEQAEKISMGGVSGTDKSGQDPKRFPAVQQGQEEILELLRQRGARVLRPNSDIDELLEEAK